MPAVSVLMPVFNGERHLAAAVDSILAQTFADFELIVVDDGSTDGSRAIVSRYRDPRIRLVALDQNAGLSHALNRGLQEVTAPLVARQDADDLAEPQRLEQQVAVMRERPGLALLGSRAITIDEDGRPTGTVWRPAAPGSILWYSLVDNPFIHTAIMFRTAAVRDEGGFDPRYDPFSQDWALWCRVMARHQFANLTAPLVRYRVRSSSIIGALDGPSGDDGYRPRFAAIVQEVVDTQAVRLFGGAATSSDERRMLAGFVLGVDPATLLACLTLIERLLDRFRQLHDEKDADDFSETLARQFDALAYRLSPPSRLAAARVYLHALHRHPELASRLSWTRAASLVVSGRTGRDSIAAWRRRLR